MTAPGDKTSRSPWRPRSPRCGHPGPGRCWTSSTGPGPPPRQHGRGDGGRRTCRCGRAASPAGASASANSSIATTRRSNTALADFSSASSSSTRARAVSRRSSSNPSGDGGITHSVPTSTTRCRNPAAQSRAPRLNSEKSYAASGLRIPSETLGEPRMVSTAAALHARRPGFPMVRSPSTSGVTGRCTAARAPSTRKRPRIIRDRRGRGEPPRADPPQAAPTQPADCAGGHRPAVAER